MGLEMKLNRLLGKEVMKGIFFKGSDLRSLGKDRCL